MNRIGIDVKVIGECVEGSFEYVGHAPDYDRDDNKILR